MNQALPQSTQRISHVRVPRSVVADPVRFGGMTDGAYLQGDLILQDGKVSGLENASSLPEGQNHRLVLPRFTEAHVHLDKCHSVDRMPAVGGDLRAAILAQYEDKVHWTEDDLRQRAARGLEELIASGCRSVRSHIDWSHGVDARTPPLSWHVTKELAEDYRDQVTLTLAPLVTLADLADTETAQVLGREIAQVNGALGSFVLDHDNRADGIDRVIRIAQSHDIALDFHVDEGLDAGLDGLPMIAQAAIEADFQGPILCGHACSLMNRSGDELEQTLELIARSGLSVVTLPTTNLYLQGRTNGTPDRRGITRLRELRAAGVPVVVGTDNVRDAFCPIGRHDPRASLSLAALTGHLDPPLADLWPMITTDAEKALGAQPTFVDQAKATDLLICEAASTTEALSSDSALSMVSRRSPE